MSTTDNKTIDTETMLKEADFMVIDLMEDAISMFLSFALAYSEEDIKIYGFYVSPAYNRLNCQISNLIGKDESGRKIREFMDTKVKCVLPSYIIDFDSIPDLEKLFTVKELETIHNDETPASLIKIVKRKTKTFFSQWTNTKEYKKWYKNWFKHKNTSHFNQDEYRKKIDEIKKTERFDGIPVGGNADIFNLMIAKINALVKTKEKDAISFESLRRYYYYDNQNPGETRREYIEYALGLEEGALFIETPECKL